MNGSPYEPVKRAFYTLDAKAVNASHAHLRLNPNLSASQALTKIEDGTYGLCEESGEPIERIRLEKQPWARLSIYYAEMEERESVRFYKAN